jgi:ribonuclease G
MSYELLASRIAGRLWAALREHGRTVELHAAPEGRDEPRVERIVKARITGEARQVGAVFADVGGPSAALVDAKDLPRIRPRIGSEIVVQIRREGREGRGPRASARPSLAGRRLVLLPEVERRAVSRRIEDEVERERLGRLIAELVEGGGWIARAAAAGAAERVLREEAERLQARWSAAQERAGRRAAPAIVVEEPDLLEQVLRDAPPEGFSRIVVDDERDRHAALDWLRGHEPARLGSLALHAGRTPLFEASGVDLDIERALARRVELPSGGHLVIEETEALVAVDVNTGAARGVRDAPQETYLSTNREAAREIARQLRLRGLGGIVVVDLIDLRGKTSRDVVIAELREALRTDPARTRIAEVDSMGLVALVRETTRPGIASRVTRPCAACCGSGRLRGPAER